ncbi:TatD family hydrolase [Halobacillus seohaensis]|uniref:TatD family hydrolase n=1 Tax=Halobacillus seohaensis TaxID=447421 RepID=A0ABW2EIT7_9BACI
MIQPIIDAHIHFDNYNEETRHTLINELDLYQVKSLISVSNDKKSAHANLQLSRSDQRIQPAIGFHPEQKLPDDQEVEQIIQLIHENMDHIVAIGEVGLPYYLRRKEPSLALGPYIKLLERFIKLAIKFNKPIILHAIYEDAPIVCDLLEKHSVTHAHFHWFKGSQATIERMIENKYYISVTPDCLYEEEIQSIIKKFPLEQMMVETDGPWPFERMFKNQVTHPKMIHESINKISEVKGLTRGEVYDQLLHNTKNFYDL